MRKAKKLYAAIGLALAAMLVASTAAIAAVTFDESTGTGFVGKGDVQLAFGWNNAQLQKNAKDVTFTYNAEEKYDVTCEWETTTGGPRPRTILHDVTNNKTVNVNSTIAYDARVKNQITGFNLNGFGAVDAGTVPQVGDTCPQAHETAVVTEVVQTSSSGGLFVNYGGTSVDITPAAPAPVAV